MTIAQQLKVKDFPFEIKDIKGKTIYYEFSNGFWFKKEFDAKGNRIYYEDSNGYWEKQEFDANGIEIYYEDSKGYWEKQEFDANGIEIYYENSNGEIKDKRPKEIVTVTLDEIAAKFSRDIEILEVRCKSSLGIDYDHGCFFVLKTEQGSIDSKDEFEEMLNRVGDAIKAALLNNPHYNENE